MKVNNYFLINMMNTLNAYAEKKLPQKINYAIIRNLLILQKEVEIYENQLKKILDEYTEHFVKDEEGNVIHSDSGLPVVSEEVHNDFYEQVNELLNIEIDVNMYYVKEEVFDYEERDYHDPLTGKDILVLQSIICKKSEE